MENIPDYGGAIVELFQIVFLFILAHVSSILDLQTNNN